MSVYNLSRRAMLAGLGGLMLGISLPGCATLPVDHTLGLGPLPQGAETDLNAYIRIAPNNVVTFQVGASEMGQGVLTSLPMVLAEELDVEWSQVRAESAPVNKAYAHTFSDFPGQGQLTGGSESIRSYTPALRVLGASARAMLVAAAAELWGVQDSACHTELGHVISGEKRASYGELAQLAASQKVKEAPPKDRADYHIVGTSPERLDLPGKVNGSAQFATDFRHPGTPEGEMLVAAVRHCPHYGGKLLSMDDAAAREMAGVVDIKVFDDFSVVVVADSYWHANRAALAVNVEWDPGFGEGLDDAEIERRIRAGFGQGTRVFKQGETQHPGGATVVSQEYDAPYLAHAMMEPLIATAWVQPERVDVWTGTQAQGTDHGLAAEAAGMPKDQVFIHTLLLGGGFGRRSFSDFVTLAVRVAMDYPVPVKLHWSREQCFARGFYRPRILCRQSAVLGEDGLPTHWHIELAGQSPAETVVPKFLVETKALAEVVAGGMDHIPYGVPNRWVDYSHTELPIHVGWWRSVQGSTNGFFRECFIDQLAQAAGQDPIDYRYALLAREDSVASRRAKGVLDAALQAAGEPPEGSSRGVALFESFGSFAAQVIDIRVEQGRVQPLHVGAAIDCGTVVHPDTVRAQIMGGLTHGLSSALYGKVSFVDGAAVPSNFHNYQVLKMDQAPRVSVAIVESGHALGGVGEPGLPPIAGALCNAIFAATGERIVVLPVGEQLRG